MPFLSDVSKIKRSDILLMGNRFSLKGFKNWLQGAAIQRVNSGPKNHVAIYAGTATEVLETFKMIGMHSIIDVNAVKDVRALAESVTERDRQLIFESTPRRGVHVDDLSKYGTGEWSTHILRVNYRVFLNFTYTSSDYNYVEVPYFLKDEIVTAPVTNTTSWLVTADQLEAQFYKNLVCMLGMKYDVIGLLGFLVRAAVPQIGHNPFHGKTSVVCSRYPAEAGKKCNPKIEFVHGIDETFVGPNDIWKSVACDIVAPLNKKEDQFVELYCKQNKSPNFV